ncbi:MAG TPA: hypothetical protein VGL32_12850 [Acidimicrobiales bacterium]
MERDRDAESRQLADTDFLAREIAAMRIALEAKASREDIAELVAELAETIDGGAAVSARGGDVNQT